jgi:serine/threonine protein kinase/Tol biopolymer transport system component
MPLAAGARIGPYEVATPLGAGGMGEVYRARDTKLNRDVALKILPELLAHDADRLARFRREAQLLAALSHPNIAGIYGFEDSSSIGSGQGGAVLALAMELIDGDDLSAIIRRGPMPLDEALPIAKQIILALEAAHEQGIVHRDLKPQNIKVTADGTVKVLDFGLAKALVPDGASGTTDLSTSPTLTARATQMGMILGTAAYMAPEQAKGRAVDKRADIWAFGCVLYEMLTSRRLFDAEDVSETLAAVLTRDVSLTAIPAHVPQRLRALVRDCVVRDPKQRLRDIGDARRVIEQIIAGTSEDPAAAPVTAHATIPASRRALPWAIAGVLGVALVSTLLMWAPWRTTAVPSPRRLLASIGVDASLTTDRGAAAVLSPDGKTLVFSARQENRTRLFIRALDQLQATPLAGTEEAAYPFFSPNGQWIAFFAGTKLKKVSAAGGAPVVLSDIASGRGGTWLDDDTIIFSPSGGANAPLRRVRASGGTPTPFGTLSEGATTQRWPQVLQGGKSVLYTESSTTGNFDGANIVVAPVPADVSAKTGPGKVIVPSAYYGRYVASGFTSPKRGEREGGHLLYVQQGTLFAVPFDPVRLEVMGTGVPAIPGVMSSPTSGGAQVDVSGDGTLAYVPGGIASNLANAIDWMTRDGQTSALQASRTQWANPRFSPNGQQVALDISDGKQRDIWVYDLARDTLTQLTFDATSETNPVWTPDGTRIVFTSDRAKVGSPRNLYWMSADGTGGGVTRLTESTGEQYPGSWHPSGKFLGYTENRGGTTRWDAMILPMDGDATNGWRPGTPTALFATAAHEDTPMFSPDGRFVAYFSNEAGGTGNDVYVRPFPGPGGPWRVSTNGGIYARWSATTRQLLWVDVAQLKVMVAPFSVAGNAFVPGKPELWSPKGFLWIADGNSYYDLHPDGKRLAIASSAGQTVQDHVVVMSSFFEYLRTIAPLKK